MGSSTGREPPQGQRAQPPLLFVAVNFLLMFFLTRRFKKRENANKNKQRNKKGWWKKVGRRRAGEWVGGLWDACQQQQALRRVSCSVVGQSPFSNHSPLRPSSLTPCSQRMVAGEKSKRCSSKKTDFVS